MMTVLHTCRLHNIDVETYLTDVLPRLAQILEAKQHDPEFQAAYRRLTPLAWQRERRTLPLTTP
jgi:hypothetical protein